MKDNSPFIHLFRSPRNYYFYDVNKDTIVLINKNEYEYLSAQTNFSDLTQEEQRHILQLKETGFLSTNRVKKVEHAYTNSINHQLNNCAQQLILQVTQSCNLTCYYCPYANVTDGILQRNHSNKKMSNTVAKQAIDFFAIHSSETENVSISFYGGEPLMMYGLIKECIQYANETLLGKNILYNITTNGTLLNDEMIAFFAENRVRLTFSIDGPASIHDINRRRTNGSGSFYEAFSNMKRALTAYGAEGAELININMVINPENSLRDVMRLFEDETFKKHDIHVVAAVAEDDSLQKTIPITDEYREVMNYQDFLGYLSHFNLVKGLRKPKINESYFPKIDENYDSFKEPAITLPESASPAGPCTPGQRRLFVSTDGIFYPCEKVNELSEIMKIGSVEGGFDVSNVLALLNVAELTAEKCQNCFAFLHCKSCAHLANGQDGLSAKKRLQYCDNMRSNFSGELQDVVLMKEIKTVYRRQQKK